MTISDPLAEYFVRPVDGGFVLDAVEIRHSALAAPLRICNDTIDRGLPIEAGAPVDAGTDQTFSAGSRMAADGTVTPGFTVTLGEQNADGLPEPKLTVNDNGGTFRTLLLPALASSTPVEVSLRSYGGTAAVPLLLEALHGLELRQAAAELGRQTVYALAWRVLARERVPFAVYDAETAPGLFV